MSKPGVTVQLRRPSPVARARVSASTL
jgi:hypothetical protein